MRIYFQKVRIKVIEKDADGTLVVEVLPLPKNARPLTLKEELLMLSVVLGIIFSGVGFVCLVKALLFR